MIGTHAIGMIWDGHTLGSRFELGAPKHGTVVTVQLPSASVVRPLRRIGLNSILSYTGTSLRCS